MLLWLDLYHIQNVFTPKINEHIFFLLFTAKPVFSPFKPYLDKGIWQTIYNGQIMLTMKRHSTLPEYSPFFTT